MLGCIIGLGLTESPELRYESNTGCAKNCEFCDMTADVCSQCGPNYVFSYSSRSCEKVENLIANCKYYTDRTRCKTCNDGFVFYGGTCTACITNCLVCNLSPTKCDTCKSGFSHASSSLQTCTVSCNLPNCHQCADGSTTTCKLCNSGFRVGGSGQCEKCSVENCNKCDSSISSCDYSGLTVNNCANGYFYLNNSCAKCGSGCLTCDNDGQCMACNTTDGKYMWNDMLCFNGNIVGVSLSLIALLTLGLI